MYMLLSLPPLKIKLYPPFCGQLNNKTYSIYVAHMSYYFCLVYIQVTVMAHKKAYEKYSEKLIKCLPMQDGLFITNLSDRNLLPLDTIFPRMPIFYYNYESSPLESFAVYM